MIEYHRPKACTPKLSWFLYFYRGATKMGDREWAVRILGVTVFNRIEE